MVPVLLQLWLHEDGGGLSNEDTCEFAALAACNLACGAVNSQRMVADGAGKVLVQFARGQRYGAEAAEKAARAERAARKVSGASPAPFPSTH
jgi:hypothetical protein